MDLSTGIAELIVILPTLIGVVVAFLVSHKIVSKRRLNTLYSYALYAAQAAEEVYATEAVGGLVKQKFAVDKVIEKTGISVDEAEMLVNAAVAGLRSSGIKAAKPGTHLWDAQNPSGANVAAGSGAARTKAR